MGSKKAGVKRIEGGIQQLFYPRRVDFGVFDERMVAVDQNGAASEENQQAKIFEVGAASQWLSVRTRLYCFAFKPQGCC